MVREKNMRASENFRDRMIRLQAELLKKDKKLKGFAQIQEKIITLPEWDLIEKKIIGEDLFDINIKFDRRTR